MMMLGMRERDVYTQDIRIDVRRNDSVWMGGCGSYELLSYCASSLMGEACMYVCMSYFLKFLCIIQLSYHATGS